MLLSSLIMPLNLRFSYKLDHAQTYQSIKPIEEGLN